MHSIKLTRKLDSPAFTVYIQGSLHICVQMGSELYWDSLTHHTHSIEKNMTLTTTLMIIWCLKLFKSPNQPTSLTSGDLLNDFAQCHTASLSAAREDGCQWLDELFTITEHYARFLQQICWPKALIRVQRVCDTVCYRDKSSQRKDFTLRSSYEKASKRPSSETDNLTALFEVYSSSLT